MTLLDLVEVYFAMGAILGAVFITTGGVLRYEDQAWPGRPRRIVTALVAIGALILWLPFLIFWVVEPIIDPNWKRKSRAEPRA